MSIDPRVDFVARSIFLAERRPNKSASWESAPREERATYMLAAMASIDALNRFDAQRAGVGYARGIVEHIETAREPGPIQEAIVRVRMPWFVVRQWTLGTTMDATVPLTKRGLEEGNPTKYDAPPADVFESIERTWRDSLDGGYTIGVDLADQASRDHSGVHGVPVIVDNEGRVR